MSFDDNLEDGGKRNKVVNCGKPTGCKHNIFKTTSKIAYLQHSLPFATGLDVTALCSVE